MISDIFLSGRLGEILERGLRYVEIDRLIPGPTGRFVVDRIIVKSQSFEVESFMKEPVGTYICLKGRLEVDPKYGLIVVKEIDEMYHFPKGTKRI